MHLSYLLQDEFPLDRSIARKLHPVWGWYWDSGMSSEVAEPTNRLGFTSYGSWKVRSTNELGSAERSTGNILFPHWFAVALFAALPAWQLARLHRRRMAKREGRCSKCGYDLRATPERCPECGAVPVKAV
jgi:hypothetical protein